MWGCARYFLSMDNFKIFAESDKTQIESKNVCSSSWDKAILLDLIKIVWFGWFHFLHCEYQSASFVRIPEFSVNVAEKKTIDYTACAVPQCPFNEKVRAICCNDDEKKNEFRKFVAHGRMLGWRSWRCRQNTPRKLLFAWESQMANAHFSISSIFIWKIAIRSLGRSI